MKYQVGDNIKVYSTFTTGEKAEVMEIMENGLLRVRFNNNPEQFHFYHPNTCRKIKEDPSTFEHLNRVIHSFRKFQKIEAENSMSEKFFNAKEEFLKYLEKAEKHTRKPVKIKKS